jgi:hypothetical protein
VPGDVAAKYHGWRIVISVSAYSALLRSSMQTSAYRPGVRVALQAGLAPGAAGRVAVIWNHGGTLVSVPALMTAWTSDSVRPAASFR